jgi:tRNA threonylcarbamoyladenosine biosynthesis protein TsaB
MELSLDTASELASIALSNEGVIAAEMTWRCRRNHTVELLPSVEKLFAQAGASKDEVSAVFVCIGPGLYTGLRVGVTTAKAMAHALGVPIVGVGRLELDAYPHATFEGDIVAVHKAGRGELAWASYRGAPWREVVPPTLSKPEELATDVRAPTLFVGEIDDALAELLGDLAVVASPAASVRRAGGLAELAYPRLAAGEVDEAALLSPVYLRPPAIGPQTIAE